MSFNSVRPGSPKTPSHCNSIYYREIPPKRRASTEAHRHAALRALPQTTPRPPRLEADRFSLSASLKLTTTSQKIKSALSWLGTKLSDAFCTASQAISKYASKIFVRFKPIQGIKQVYANYQAGKIAAAEEKAAVKELSSWQKSFAKAFFTGKTAYLIGHPCRGRFYTEDTSGLYLHLLKHKSTNLIKTSRALIQQGERTLAEVSQKVVSEEGRAALKNAQDRLTSLKTAIQAFDSSYLGLEEQLGREYSTVVERTLTNFFTQVHWSCKARGETIPTVSKMPYELTETLRTLRVERAHHRQRREQDKKRAVSYDSSHIDIDPTNPRGFGVTRM